MEKFEQKKNLRTIFLLKRLWTFLSERKKRHFLGLLILMLLSGCAEIISFTSVVPFLTVLTDPQTLFSNKNLYFIFQTLNIQQPNQLITPISLFFIFISVIAASIKLSTIWISGRFAASLGSEISSSSFTKTLMQPYSVHIEKNSSSVISTNTAHVTSTVLVLHQTLWFISNLIISILILFGLFLVDFWVAFTLLLIFGASYTILVLKVKLRLMRNSRFISDANQKQIKIIQESLGSIRDIILDKTYFTFISIHKNIDLKMRLKNADSIFLSIYPRNILEVVGIIFLVSIALIINIRGGNSINQSLPLLGAFALGAQRLLPAMQQSYNAWATINAYSSELFKVIESLEQKVNSKLFGNKLENFNNENHFLKNKIIFKDVCFKYKNELPMVIKNISFEIRKGENIGIIGSTGCGKSTLIDLIMGLLVPSNGQILVDSKNIHSNSYLSHWQNKITHVPQDIYLTDNSFAENIAFGIPFEEINLKKVKEAAEMAMISDFIESSKQGYKTYVGEAGITISGGQKQRIGIARALYKKSELIIFDEATSALDQKTEKSVMRAINNLNKEITTIFIAHRLSTLNACDKIIEIKKGSLIINKINK